ncbi:MAG: hypothetical protein ABN482_01255 [Corticimicrobacter sp.]|uniref:hypothetical protein n=1 Tax=Corticimicrobacter sp. TaxID=2678536 RepID=UPI0032DAE011
MLLQHCDALSVLLARLAAALLRQLLLQVLDFGISFPRSIRQERTYLTARLARNLKSRLNLFLVKDQP